MSAEKKLLIASADVSSEKKSGKEDTCIVSVNITIFQSIKQTVWAYNCPAWWQESWYGCHGRCVHQQRWMNQWAALAPQLWKSLQKQHPTIATRRGGRKGARWKGCKQELTRSNAPREEFAIRRSPFLSTYETPTKGRQWEWMHTRELVLSRSTGQPVQHARTFKATRDETDTQIKRKTMQPPTPTTTTTTIHL